MVDNRGTELKVGQMVAYNLSGQIAKGKIVGVKAGGSSYNKARIEIELLHRAAGLPEGHHSIVTNPLNVLVLSSTACPHCGQDPVQGEF